MLKSHTDVYSGFTRYSIKPLFVRSNLKYYLSFAIENYFSAILQLVFSFSIVLATCLLAVAVATASALIVCLVVDWSRAPMCGAQA